MLLYEDDDDLHDDHDDTDGEHDNEDYDHEKLFHYNSTDPRVPHFNMLLYDFCDFPIDFRFKSGVLSQFCGLQGPFFALLSKALWWPQENNDKDIHEKC